ncbi:MAG: hypothetical protein ABIS86_10065 [Streptosporangiaceae bacterium]
MRDVNNFGIDVRVVRKALTVLRPDEAGRPPDRDAAFLLGRLVATVEQCAGAGGHNNDWTRFDAGYRSALGPEEMPVAGIKRMMRTARQLTGMSGLAAQSAAAGLVAATSALFAEVLLSDDDSPLAATLEQLDEATEMFGRTLELVGHLRRTLTEFDLPA